MKYELLPVFYCSASIWLQQVELGPPAAQSSHSSEGSWQHRWLRLPLQYQGNLKVWYVCLDGPPVNTWKTDWFEGKAAHDLNERKIDFIFTKKYWQNLLTYLVTPGVAPTLHARARFKLLIKLLFPTFGKPETFR